MQKKILKIIFGALREHYLKTLLLGFRQRLLSKMKENHAILLIVCLAAFYFDECVCHGHAPKPAPKPSVKPYKCCDQSQSNDCKCSNQTGGVGKCMCSPSNAIRDTWFCINDNVNGDSVSENGI
jgi:hypothetical protein